MFIHTPSAKSNNNCKVNIREIASYHPKFLSRDK
jgi:hypothetical protein